jgi:putative IMPACT (imprinted ancient) family translation regulator
MRCLRVKAIETKSKVFRLFSSKKGAVICPPPVPLSYEISDNNSILSSSISIKKSKFTATIGHASTIEDALKFVEKHKESRATHNCWAFRSVTYERSFDDKEVSGTAGKPISLAMNSENLFNCVVLVTRYYGGINLGRGGLFKAYYNVSKQVCANIEKKRKEIRIV